MHTHFKKMHRHATNLLKHRLYARIVRKLRSRSIIPVLYLRQCFKKNIRGIRVLSASNFISEVVSVSVSQESMLPFQGYRL